MLDTFSIKEAKSAPKNGKIRLVFKSFEDFMANIDEIPKIQGQFTRFTVKHDYEKKTQVVRKKQVRKKSFDQIFQDYLKTVENKEVRTIIKNVWYGSVKKDLVDSLIKEHDEDFIKNK